MAAVIEPCTAKRVCLKTYGCQMNVHDSERMLGMLEGEGYGLCDGYSDANVIILNTCSVREKPENKLFAELGRLKKLKRDRPDLIVCVAGCMAPRDGDIIRQKAPFVDILLGPRSIHRLPDLVRKVELVRKPVDAVDLFDDPTPLTAIRRAGAVSAWVDVMFGCNYQCTYCAVPSARGKEVSRRPEEIFREIDDLYRLGFREVTLLGQTVNAYGRDFKYRLADGAGDERIDFAWLLGQIDSREPGLRVRFTSPHPQLFNRRLIRAIADLPSVCEHVHLPLQSGDNEVLRSMKRSYTIEKFMQIVGDLRETVPNIAITTDLIAGFPGETEEQFRNTLEAVEKIQFDHAFMFAYSPRRATEAFAFEDELPDDIKKRRLNELIALVNRMAQEKNKKSVGKVFEVLVEGPSEKNPEMYSGRTRENKMCIFECAEEFTGQLVNVRADEAFMWGFKGKIIPA